MKDEELIEKMREAVTIETAHPNDDDPTEWQLVNDACLLSLAAMVRARFKAEVIKLIRDRRLRLIDTNQCNSLCKAIE